MKRKLMCLFLAFVMVFASLAAAGCSASDDEMVEGGTTDESALTTVTLTLWLPTNRNTSEAAILAVQEELNKILNAKFETAIELHAIPYDEYDEAIDARLTEIEEKIAQQEAEEEERRQKAKEMAANGITTAEETTGDAETSEGEETFVNDLGMTMLKYPEVEDTQMDIFLVRGYDNYQSYIQRSALASLDNELNGASKILKQYIHPTFLENAKLGSTYAIPNNHVIGEYKYLLVNKKLVDQLYWDPAKLTDFAACGDFIRDVKAYTDVTPLLATAEAAGMEYWSADGKAAWSLLASQVTKDMDYLSYCPPVNVLTNENYTKVYSLMKHLKEEGCVATNPYSVNEFGVGIVSGDASLAEKYADDYYVTIYEAPVATTEEIFGSMFAVSSYTKSVTRSMEVLTLLNTDKELRTILQYGVEGLHWAIDENDENVIKILRKDYSMNLKDTGNVFMTYPEEGVPMEAWDIGKKQNLDSIVSPYVGFSVKNYSTDATRSDLLAVDTLSKTVFARIEAMSAEEFDAALPGLLEELAAETALTRASSDQPTDKTIISAASLYYTFHNAKPKPTT